MERKLWHRVVGGTLVVGISLGGGIWYGMWSAKSLAKRQEISAVGTYLAARHARHVGDNERARQLFHTLPHVAHKDPALKQELLDLALIAGDWEDVHRLTLSDAAKGTALSDHGTLAVAIEAVQAGDPDRAAELLSHTRGGFESVLYPMLSAWALSPKASPDRIAGLLDQSAQLSPLLAAYVDYQRALIADSMGRPKLAVRAIRDYFAHGGKLSERSYRMFHATLTRAGETVLAESLQQRLQKEHRSSWLEATELRRWLEPDAHHSIPPLTPLQGMADVLYGAASLHVHREGMETAQAYLQLALRLDPDFYDARLLLGSVYEQQGQYAEAIATYQRIPRATLPGFKAMVQIARNYDSMGHTARAVGLLRQAAAEYPESHAPFVYLGDILKERQRFREAAKAYEQATQRISAPSKEHWVIWYARGISYERSGQWEKAEQDLYTALKLSPHQPDVMNYLGYTWISMGKHYQKAHDLLAEAVALSPRDGHIVDSLGWAKHLMGQKQEAVRFLERAVELMPTDATVNDHLGDAYAAVGRMREARFQWKRALHFDPDATLELALRKKLEEPSTAMLPVEDGSTQTAQQQQNTPATP
jgi:tetratricopeptide (TPR) repeat protein